MGWLLPIRGLTSDTTLKHIDKEEEGRYRESVMLISVVLLPAGGRNEGVVVDEREEEN